MRGEHAGPSVQEACLTGSSPRARGTRPQRRGGAPSDRIIPACAGNTAAQRRGTHWRPDHPRVRGEHLRSSSPSRRSAGSSPRARGTPHAGKVIPTSARIIPACAGNTSCCRSAQSCPPDHPRVRGEHIDAETKGDVDTGSSPRARGTHPCELRGLTARRIIPACAGNTVQPDSACKLRPDHPRVRGEHLRRLPKRRNTSGSSPRARGTLPRRVRPLDAGRIIPACAGNTSLCTRSEASRPDHPRVRGEHGTVARWVGASGGSSPRARGTPDARTTARVGRRIIPACAGNTHACRSLDARQTDHPRVRGEHPLDRVDRRRCGGSSPRARGTHVLHRPEGSRRRIIPACAGNTLLRSTLTTTPTDHPRVRGEHAARRAWGGYSPGSSPRARGTRRRRQEPADRGRIIPACAGNTRARTPGRSISADHPRVRGEHCPGGC